MIVDVKNYGFIDFGSSKAGCLAFATKHLNGRINNGIGVELNPNKCKIIQKKGFPCIQADLTDISFTKNSVKFITISHLLEHLKSHEEVEYVLKLAADTAKNFLFIEGPSFDFDAQLREKGFKFYWSDWRGHSTLVRINFIIKTLKKLGYKYNTLLVEKPYITHSKSKDIHSLESPIDQLEYNPKVHPKKRRVSLGIPGLFRSFIIYCWLDGVARPHNYLAHNKFIVKKRNL